MRVPGRRSWGALIYRARRWQRQTFAEETLEERIGHLAEEVEELVGAPLDGEEVADVFLVLLGVAGALRDRDPTFDLFDAVERKLEVCEASVFERSPAGHFKRRKISGGD